MSNKDANKVDKIRDLIFGNQIKEFDEEFSKLHKSIEKLESKMMQNLASSHTKLQEETKHSLLVLNKKLEELTFSTQQDKANLKQQIETSQQGLEASIQTQHEKFSKKIKQMKEDMVDETQKTSQRLASLRQEIEMSLEKNLSSLTEDKLSKDAMAQMLVDVAMKMQEPNKTVVKGKKAGK